MFEGDYLGNKLDNVTQNGPKYLHLMNDANKGPHERQYSFVILKSLKFVIEI